MIALHLLQFYNKQTNKLSPVTILLIGLGAINDVTFLEEGSEKL